MRTFQYVHSVHTIRQKRVFIVPAAQHIHILSKSYILSEGDPQTPTPLGQRTASFSCLCAFNDRILPYVGDIEIYCNEIDMKQTYIFKKYLVENENKKSSFVELPKFRHINLFTKELCKCLHVWGPFH